MLNRAVVVKDVMLDAEHAKFGPSTDSQPGPTTLLLATGLMRHGQPLLRSCWFPAA